MSVPCHSGYEYILGACYRYLDGIPGTSLSGPNYCAERTQRADATVLGEGITQEEVFLIRGGYCISLFLNYLAFMYT